MKTQLLLSAGLMLLPCVATANCSNLSSNRVDCTGAVVQLRVNDANETLVYISGQPTTGLNCTSGDFFPTANAWRIPEGPLFQKWNSLALAAIVGGLQLAIVSNSAVNGSCTIERIELTP